MKPSNHLSKLRKRIFGEKRTSKPQRRRLLIESLEGRRLLTTIDLAALTAAQGTTIFGVEANDRSGISVSSAGDVNGDGFDDLLIGAYLADGSGNAKSNAGESYVIFGEASLPATIDLASLGTAGITIFGADMNDNSGISVSIAGDVNGDGFDDLLIGAFFAESSAGESYVIFGGASLPTTIDLASLGTAGVTIFGADSSDLSGDSVSSAGDVNGDGFDDLLIGARHAAASGNGKDKAGDSYVIVGGASLPTAIDLASLGTAGVTIFGAEAYDRSGKSVSSAGDVNGDGFDDLLIGTPFADALGNAKDNAGDSYVIFGGASLPATIDLASLGTAGITIIGADAGDYSGFSVSSAGDINGDGFDDFLIGAYRADALGNAKSNAGDSYVIFGGASLSATIDLANLGTGGVTIFGSDAVDSSGRSVSNAGDVNGDGFDDLLIGARGAAASGNAKLGSGDSYVIFGGASLSATIDLASLGMPGITFFGADAFDSSGGSVSSAGDVNGDGVDDVLIGAVFADALANAKSSAGESYVIFGGNFTGSVTHPGTNAAETLTGTAGADVMVGDQGGDTLVGGGGADVLIGGQGNDILAISDPTFKRIVGGTDTDTLRLDGSGLNLDLITIADNRILGLEQIDITGSGDNTLTLDLQEVLNISDESNTLLVRRNTGDTVNIGSGWTQGTNETIGADTFEVYTQGAATLKVQAVAALQITTIDLAALTAAQGTTIFGADAGDLSGLSVSSAGDVNGDGFDDLLIGAPTADASGNAKSDAGESYVIFGGATLQPTIDLANLGTAGITIFGADANDKSGDSVSSAGDVNGDGFDDLLIGARTADASGNTKNGAGDSYVIFGGAALPTTINLANLGTAGITIFGADPLDQSGFSVSNAGDVNGDGFDDLVIGAFAADASGNAKLTAGDNYVIFGGSSLPTTINLATLGTAGITIFGAEANDRSGRSVSSVGDVNGDGFDDLLIGAYYADASGNAKFAAGDSYVIFGGVSLPTMIDLANLGTAGITIFGADAYDRSGYSVSSAGDMNGDGFDDLLIGARNADSSGNGKSDAGDSYVVFGGSSLPPTLDLANLGTAGITIFGADANDQSGRAVSSAGDVNGDGFDDLLIGAKSAAASGNAKVGAGESYVLFGGAALAATLDLANLGTGGVTIFGADALDQSAYSVSSAGDVNGDGFDDLLIGAVWADASGDAKSLAGDSYVIFGGDFTAAVTHQGTSAGETLTGTAGADVMIGDRGDDTLIGDGGADVLIGGQGNDILAVSDLTFQRIVGGTGTDTLRLDGSGLHLDLTTIADNRILGIEQIDITGSGDNTLTLDLQEVLNISDESNTLIVRRNVGDTVNIGAGWTQDPNQTIGPDTFEVFTQGQAVVKLQATITPTLTINDVSVTEGNAGSVNAVFTVTLSAASGQSVSVNYATANDTAVAPGDYTANSNTLTFAPGETTKTITVLVQGDLLDEVNETFFVNLSSATNATISDSQGQGTITDDDATPTLAINDVTVTEGNAGSVNATFTVTLSAASGQSVTVNYATANSTAVAPGDYTSTSGTLTFAAGETSKTIVVPVLGDTLDEAEETFFVNLTSPTHATLADGQGQGTITDDDDITFVIDLAALTVAQGTTIFGADAGDQSGFAVSSAGDVNGDGFDDLLIGARYADASGNAKLGAGDSYVIFGGDSLPATIDLANLGIAGITIFGADAGDQSGRSVSSAGDVNGDGFDDLLIGASSADGSGDAKLGAGDIYVIFGGASLPATIDLASLGTAGITIFGANVNDASGRSVSSVGDVNGDGFDDLLIGANFADASGNGKAQAGDIYVIFGGASLPVTIDLASLGTAGITIFGADGGDLSGSSVSSAGDVNGDGFDDLLIGAYHAAASGNGKAQAGDSYVIFGGASLPTTIDLVSLGTAGITIFGAEAGDNSGFSVSSAGDVNGDGFDDVLIGAIRADGSGNSKLIAGDGYVIFGGPSVPTTIDLASLGTAGITIFGADAGDYSGHCVRSAGDLNGDGFDDLLIGAPFADASGNAKSSAGDSYVIFGGASLPATIDLASLGTAGITIFGADVGDHSGYWVSSAGDVNGDGFDDLLIGALNADASENAKSNAGESYVIFGGNFTSAVTHPGTAAAETLTGSAGVDVMIGDRGDDTLVGDGGADVLIGGQGNDILTVNDLNFKRIVGGTGTDTLRLDGSGLHLDLTTIADNRIQGVEQIDLTGSGDNTLTLDLQEVLNISDESNTLLVRRNMGDTVIIGSGWTQGTNETIGPDTFEVYTQGAATLKVQAVAVFEFNQNIQLGNGSNQRSSVRSLTVNFDEAIEFDTGAFQVFRRDQDIHGQLLLVPVNTSVSLAPVAGGMTATLTFSGSQTRGSGSLIDGNYQLVLNGNLIRKAGTTMMLDADGDGAAGGQYVYGAQATDQFFALYGDINGDRVLDTVDFIAFRSAYRRSLGNPAYREEFDFNDDGVIDQNDYIQFRNLYTKRLNFK